MKKYHYILPVLFALVLCAPFVATAAATVTLPDVNVIVAAPACTAGANGFVPLACTTGSSLDAAYKSPDLGTYINALFKIALSVGAMLAVLRLVYAGYIYMISGVGSFASQGKAKEIIGSVVFGLILLLAIYLILFQINPQILNLNVLFSNSAAPATPTTAAAPLNPALGGVGGASNIQKDTGTGLCYIPDPNTGGLDQTPCP